jgi:hypothetical protein
MFKDRKEKRTEGCVSMNAIAVGAGKRCLAVRAEVSENSDRRGIAAAAAPGSSKNIAVENMPWSWSVHYEYTRCECVRVNVNVCLCDF